MGRICDVSSATVGRGERVNVFRTQMCWQTLLFIVIANCAIIYSYIVDVVVSQRPPSSDDGL